MVLRGVVVFLLAAGFRAEETTTGPPTHETSTNVIGYAKVWLTTADATTAEPRLLLGRQSDVRISNRSDHDARTREAVLNIDGPSELQSIVGFGAAMTHASASVLQSLKRRKQSLYWDVMSRLFGVDSDSAGITLMRVPIGSSDFDTKLTTWADDHGYGHCATCNTPGACAKNCSDLRGFTLHPGTDKVFEVLSDAKSIYPNLTLIGSPWTPPRWVRRYFSRHTPQANTLPDDDIVYDVYAKYLQRVVRSFEERGHPLTYLTLQNEPLNGWCEWCMYLSADNYARLGRKVKALLGDSPRLLTFDHNWDAPEYPKATIDASPGVFTGTAWHCYAGQMGPAHSQFQREFPELEQLVTECTGSYPDDTCDISKGMHHFGHHNAWDLQNVLLGAISHHARGATKWNVVLDENCGPYLPEPMDYHWGRPLVSIPSTATALADIHFNQDFWTLAAMSRFVRPGAHVVSSRSFNLSNSLAVAFKDNSTETMTVIAFNAARHKSLVLEVRLGNCKLQYTLPAWATAVFVWSHTSAQVSACGSASSTFEFTGDRGGHKHAASAGRSVIPAIVQLFMICSQILRQL